MLDDALVPGKTCRKYLHEYVSILVVLDDALVQGNIVAVTLPKGIVSILVVLDDALVLPGENIEKHACNIVSILVVLDDALVHKLLLDEIQAEGLNPCCAGRCSSTIRYQAEMANED